VTAVTVAEAEARHVAWAADTFETPFKLTGGGCLRRNSNEKMRPLSRKTRIRCTLPELVERQLVDSRAVLFGPLRSSSWAGTTRTPNIAGPLS